LDTLEPTPEAVAGKRELELTAGTGAGAASPGARLQPAVQAATVSAATVSSRPGHLSMCLQFYHSTVAPALTVCTTCAGYVTLA
jgi:hypothetical protein